MDPRTKELSFAQIEELSTVWNIHFSVWVKGQVRSSRAYFPRISKLAAVNCGDGYINFEMLVCGHWNNISKDKIHQGYSNFGTYFD